MTVEIPDNVRMPKHSVGNLNSSNAGRPRTIQKSCKSGFLNDRDLWYPIYPSIKLSIDWWEFRNPESPNSCLECLRNQTGPKVPLHPTSGHFSQSLYIHTKWRKLSVKKKEVGPMPILILLSTDRIQAGPIVSRPNESVKCKRSNSKSRPRPEPQNSGPTPYI